LDDSWTKTADVKSGKGTIAMTFEIESTSGSGNGAINMTIAADATDETKPVGDMSMNATLDMGASGKIVLQNTQFRVTGNKLYFNVAGLQVTGDELGGDSITALLASYFNKWFVIDPENAMIKELLASAASSVATSPTESQLTPEEADKMLKIVSTAKIVTGVTYSTEEKIDGVNCVKISFTGLDADGIIALVEAINTEFGGVDAAPITAADKKDMKDSLAAIQAAGSFWVGKDDGLLRKIDLSLAMEQDGDKGNIGIVATMTDLNKAVTVVQPAGAQDFMEVITPYLGALGGSSGYDTTDYTDYTDYSNMTDAELNDLLNSLQ